MRKRIILERMGKRCFANIAGKSWKMMPRFVRIAVRPSRMRRRRRRSLRSRTPDRTNSCSTGRPYSSRAHRAHRTRSRRDSTGRISTGKTNTDSSLNRFRPITISPLSIRSSRSRWSRRATASRSRGLCVRLSALFSAGYSAA